MNSKRSVGKIKSAHGLKGEVYIIIFSNEKDWFEEVDEISIGTDLDLLKSYKVVESSFHKDGVIAQLEGVTDRNQSELLKGLEVFVDSQIFEIDPSEEGFYLAQIENFKVYNHNVLIGTITGFSFNGANDLILVQTLDDKSFSIPLVDEFIQEIKFDEKEIFMELPEGLLESQE